MARRTASMLFAALALTGCNIAVPTSAPSGNTEIGRVIQGRGRAYACGSIGYAASSTVQDSPSYYYDLKNGKIVGGCAMVCTSKIKDACTCRPAAWKCNIHLF
jgi:hypothetical protein